MRIFVKSTLVLFVVMSLAFAAMAAPTNSGLVGGKAPSGDSLETEIEGGIMVAASKVVKRNNDRVVAVYLITAEDDTTIKIAAGNIYDNSGNEFNKVFRDFDNDNYPLHIFIGSNQVSERLIIGGVPTPVEIHYRCNDKYELASLFPRAMITVNGKSLTFKNVKGEK
jgi:hypothetical protein